MNLLDAFIKGLSLVAKDDTPNITFYFGQSDQGLDSFFKG